MSEPIPEAVPTSADPRSKRPVKRARTGNNAIANQADEIENLMWDPTRSVELPALSAETRSRLAAPPEIVANVQGSSAGAGSGEFHVYKASRRREYERLKVMDEEAKAEEDKAKWEEQERQRREKDEEKTRKNREKRNKRKKGKPQEGKRDDTSSKTEAARHNGANGTKKNVDVPQTKDSGDETTITGATAGKPFAVADVAKENGLIIHDDD